MSQTAPTNKESKAYRLRSPYHSNKNYAKNDLKSTNSVSFKRPIDESIINEMSKKSDKNTTNAMKSLKHLPPKYKVNGLQIAENAKDACKIYQVLSPKTNKKINYSESLMELDDLPRHKRKEKKHRIHSSFDLDGDGVVGIKEFAISNFFDVDGDGKLNENERRNALDAIKDGIEQKYSFSAKGIHKYTEDELAAMNGGWFKHNHTKQREQTLSNLKIKRKQTQKNAATQIAEKCLINKQNNKIPIEFPYEYAPKVIEEKKEEKVAKINPNKTRSELFEKRRMSHMDGLEKSRFECEQYFKPIAFRKLDFLEDSLRKRSLRKSTKTLKDVINERHAQNKETGKFWESKTNFDIFNAKKLEREFWKNRKIEENDGNNVKIESISNEIYNFSKKRSVAKLPLPFECEYDSFKERKQRFLAKPIAEISYEKCKSLPFKQFSEDVGEIADNLCVLYGGKTMTGNDEGVSSWFKERKSALNDTAEMFSSFSSDGIFREPVFSISNKSRVKTNLFKTQKRPKTAFALNANRNYTNQQKKNNNIYRHQSKKKKIPIRTSGFCDLSCSYSNSSDFKRLRVTL